MFKDNYDIKQDIIKKNIPLQNVSDGAPDSNNDNSLIEVGALIMDEKEENIGVINSIKKGFLKIRVFSSKKNDSGEIIQVGQDSVKLIKSIRDVIKIKKEMRNIFKKDKFSQEEITNTEIYKKKKVDELKKILKPLYGRAIPKTFKKNLLMAYAHLKKNYSEIFF